MAMTLGWFDIRLRYRGSVLGPFWLTLSTAVMVAALGVLYSALFKMELHDYLPYLAVSLVLWNALATVVGEACTCFLQSEGMIRSMRMPFTLYAGRVLVRNLLVLAHNVVVILIVYAWFDVWPGVLAIEALPGLAIWLLDALAACMLLGALCARFRDIPADRGQRDADRVLREPDHLEARAADGGEAGLGRGQPVLLVAGDRAGAVARGVGAVDGVGVGAGI